MSCGSRRRLRRGGGIGRRAWFRSMWGQPRGGSSPLLGTTSKLDPSCRSVPAAPPVRCVECPTSVQRLQSRSGSRGEPATSEPVIRWMRVEAAGMGVPGSTRVSIRGSPRTVGPRIATAPIRTMRSFATSSPVVSRSSATAGSAASAVCLGGRRASRLPGAQPKRQGCCPTVDPSRSVPVGTRPDATAGSSASAAWLREAAGIEVPRRSIEGVVLDDGLVAFRPGREEVDRDSGERFDPPEVRARVRRQTGARPDPHRR